jgi:hypothetical protein
MVFLQINKLPDTVIVYGIRAKPIHNVPTGKLRMTGFVSIPLWRVFADGMLLLLAQ